MNEADPRFWTSLYKPPTASSDAGEHRGDLEFAEDDLRAEIDLLDETPQLGAIDAATLEALVERLVQERLAALGPQLAAAAAGGLPAAAPAAAAPPVAAAPPAAAPAKASPAKPAPTAAAPPAAAPAKASPAKPAPAAARPAAPKPPPAAQPKPRPLAPPPPPPPDPDVSASAVVSVIDESFDDDDDEVFEMSVSASSFESSPVAADGSQSDLSNDEFVFHLGTGDEDYAADDQEARVRQMYESGDTYSFNLGDDDDDDDEPAQIELTAGDDDDDVSIEDLLDSVPQLPGGQGGLLNVAGLSTESMQVLVMIDGNTSLRGLRTLVPHVDEERFATIVAEAVEQGLVTFD